MLPLFNFCIKNRKAKNRDKRDEERKMKEKGRKVKERWGRGDQWQERKGRQINPSTCWVFIYSAYTVCSFTNINTFIEIDIYKNL